MRQWHVARVLNLTALPVCRPYLNDVVPLLIGFTQVTEGQVRTMNIYSRLLTALSL